MTTGKLPMVRVETIRSPKAYKPQQLQRAVMIATVCRAVVFVLTAPPEHA